MLGLILINDRQVQGQTTPGRIGPKEEEHQRCTHRLKTHEDRYPEIQREQDRQCSRKFPQRGVSD